MKDQEMTTQNKPSVAVTEIRIKLCGAKNTLDHIIKAYDERQIRQLNRWVEALGEIQEARPNISFIIDLE